MPDAAANRHARATRFPGHPSGRRYDMLALDLDGTLLQPDGSVSQADLHAVAAAREAGIRVVVCTGRGLVESVHVCRWIAQRDPVVVAGGAIIACPQTGRTLHRAAIDQRIVERTVRTVLDHGHAALVLKDPADAGYDYLVVRGERELPLDPVTEWWFDAMNVKVRAVRTLDDDPHPEHTVRVGACGTESRMAAVKARLSHDGAVIHHFPAVVAPAHVSATGNGETLHVLEVFDKTATKWSAISRLAEGFGTPPERIAAIGDQINDADMIAGAGLGVAMGNAIPMVRELADRTTLTNTQSGVAHAIGRILAGEW